MIHNPIWNRSVIASALVTCGLIMPAAHADNQYEIEISGVVEIEAGGERAKGFGACITPTRRSEH